MTDWGHNDSDGFYSDLPQPKPSTSISDPGIRPDHYRQGTLEVILAIEGLGLEYHAGNIVKYVARYRYKNGIEDLKKAQWYLTRLIEREEEKLEKSGASPVEVATDSTGKSGATASTNDQLETKP